MARAATMFSAHPWRCSLSFFQVIVRKPEKIEPQPGQREKFRFLRFSEPEKIPENLKHLKSSHNVQAPVHSSGFSRFFQVFSGSSRFFHAFSGFQVFLVQVSPLLDGWRRIFRFVQVFQRFRFRFFGHWVASEYFSSFFKHFQVFQVAMFWFRFYRIVGGFFWHFICSGIFLAFSGSDFTG